MHFQEDNVKCTEQQKKRNRKEVHEAYATNNHMKLKNMNDSKPPAVGSHTTETIHHKSQSEGGGIDKTYKGHENTNSDNFTQSGDEDDWILLRHGLRTKGATRLLIPLLVKHGIKVITIKETQPTKKLFDQKNLEKLKEKN